MDALKLKLDFVRSQEGENAWKAVEYIETAENQEGEEYWGQFESLQELLDDFEIYLQYWWTR